MTNLEPHWYVFYTAPRAEKAVNDELHQRGYESFLPLHKTFRVWKNRQRKMIYNPLFPGYIFARSKENEIYNILQTPKICTCIKCDNKPSAVPEKIIEGIRLMLGLEQDIFVEHDFTEGEHVRIVQGPLSGYQGILVKKKGKCRFGIQLKEINQVVSIDIQASMLERGGTYKWV